MSERNEMTAEDYRRSADSMDASRTNAASPRRPAGGAPAERIVRLLTSEAFRRLQWQGDAPDGEPPEITGQDIADFAVGVEPGRATPCPWPEILPPQAENPVGQGEPSSDDVRAEP